MLFVVVVVFLLFFIVVFLCFFVVIFWGGSVCVYICVCMYACVCIYVYVCVCVYGCRCMYMCVYICLCLCLTFFYLFYVYMTERIKKCKSQKKEALPFYLARAFRNRLAIPGANGSPECHMYLRHVPVCSLQTSMLTDPIHKSVSLETILPLPAS